jgi:hypothetical protein
VAIIGAVAPVLVGKLIVDPVFQLWSVRICPRWVGDPTRPSLAAATGATLIGPFTFQLLLQTGALLGWMRAAPRMATTRC